MNGDDFKAEQQPNGTYIMSVSGKTYRCKDWKDVVATYKKHMEGKKHASEEGITPVSEHV